ncbi:3-deoxy-D-manno-octulosonic acid transferase [Compostibacter hankyongensis]|uniref:3-deoxy-D-manno-octulosonic acid transferase n=1 Tax=Compostibacter hankyongensis TaxID=1007089 RepID=A0ABP8FI41_9BACT
MGVLLYDIVIRLYGAAIRLAALFNAKAALWVQGRRGWRQRLAAFYAPGGSGSGAGQWVWVHCASLGEFEQGRPVVEALKSRYPQVRILLTFFSPSGYEIRKDYAGADLVSYLPLDTKANAAALISRVKPALVIFVKYEFWYHYLHELARQKIPVLLIAAIFRPGQPFFKRYGGLFRGLLRSYTHIFVQDAASAELLQQAGTGAVSIAGDTRFDRVAMLAAQRRRFPQVEAFLEGRRALVAGSTWPADERLLAACFRRQPPAAKWILAPHEIHSAHLEQLEMLFAGETVRYSALQEAGGGGKRILLIDNIGMLSALYAYGWAAYIGGGFGHGIHNILEAAVYGMPVLFGPRFGKFREAHALIGAGGAFPVQDEKGLCEQLARLSDPLALQAAATAAAHYVKEQTGATPLIMDYIEAKRFLTRV